MMTGACLSLSLFLSLSLSGVNPFIVDEAFFISILHIHISVWPPSQRSPSPLLERKVVVRPLFGVLEMSVRKGYIILST